MKLPMIMAAAAVALTGAANAGLIPGTPVTTAPPVISALGGDVKAIYIFADAGDASNLSLVTAPPVNPIFCNHPTAACLTANHAGDVTDLGNRSGTLEFTLQDTTTGHTYSTNSPDVDGNYHTFVTTNFADIGITLSSADQAAVNAALAGLTNITYVAWEDHSMEDSKVDWDYNDLIFAFSATAPEHNPGVPEPLTLSLLGAGLLGAFGLRRSKKKA